MLRIVCLLTLLSLTVVPIAHGGFDNRGEGVVSDGEPLETSEVAAVSAALDEMAVLLAKPPGKIEVNLPEQHVVFDMRCLDCLRAMLARAPDGTRKICRETAGGTPHAGLVGANAISGANAKRGPTTACNDGVDAININPTSLDKPPGYLKALLAHEWCHLVQDPAVLKGPASEIPCHFLELGILQRNRDSTVASIADPAERERVRRIFDERIRELLDVVIPGLKESRRQEIRKERGPEKNPKEPKGEKPYIHENFHRYSIRTNRSALFVVPAPGTGGSFTRHRLRRTTPPGSKIFPLDLRIDGELLLLTAVDRTHRTGLVKALDLAGATLLGERWELVLPTTRPVGLAWDRARGRLFLLDTLGQRVLCLEDRTADERPDVTIEYATVDRFPSLATALALGAPVDGRPADLVLIPRDVRGIDYADAPEPVTALYDDDGDCVADRSATVLVTTTTTSSTTTTTLGGCGFDSGAAQCAGTCPAGSTCFFASGSCQCAPDGAACGSGAAPVCAGLLCPGPAQQCLPAGTICACNP